MNEPSQWRQGRRGPGGAGFWRGLRNYDGDVAQLIFAKASGRVQITSATKLTRNRTGLGEESEGCIPTLFSPRFPNRLDTADSASRNECRPFHTMKYPLHFHNPSPSSCQPSHIIRHKRGVWNSFAYYNYKGLQELTSRAPKSHELSGAQNFELSVPTCKSKVSGGMRSSPIRSLMQ